MEIFVGTVVNGFAGILHIGNVTVRPGQIGGIFVIVVDRAPFVVGSRSGFLDQISTLDDIGFAGNV